MAHRAAALSLLTIAALQGMVVAVGEPALPATQRRPSVLFCSPSGPDQSTPANVVDLAYLAKLHNLTDGFEVDWTSDLTDVTQERLWKYNVVVVFCEGARRCAGGFDNDPTPTNMPNLLGSYAAAGGGVLLLPSEMNVGAQMLQNTTKLFGAQLPAEIIVQGDSTFVPGQWPDKTLGQGMTNMPGVTMAFTDNVPPSPISAGVRGCWYPTSIHYNAQDTNCLKLPQPWTSVLKASKGSHTEPVQFNLRNQPEKDGWPMDPPPTNAPVRPNGTVHEPDLMGIRSFGRGRVALLAMWDQFLFGSGEKWLFDSQILSRGDGKARPSDTEKLVLNTLQWLAVPSLGNSSSGIGGYITTADRLQYPNMQMKSMETLNETHYPYDKSALSNDPAAGDGSSVFSGLIGAQTSHGGGKSTVQDYAGAASASGINFVAFLEPYTSLTNTSFAALVAECKQYSTPDLLLWAGWTIDTNIGDHYFGYGPEPTLPPPELVDSSSRLIIQPTDPQDPNNYTGMNGPSFSWLLAPVQNNDRSWNTGYYNFSSTTGTLEPYDLRAYGQLALQLWCEGELVEDNTEGYLTTVESTMIGAPIALHQISTAAMLTSAVGKKQGLTHVVKDPGWSGTGLNDSLVNIWSSVGLAWNDQYDNQMMFAGDGPVIRRFPCTLSCQSRIWTLGAERFVTGRNLMPLNISVSSDKGIKDVSIWKGRTLYRRYLPAGNRSFHRTLLLPGEIQKDLVLIAQDIDGGRSVSFEHKNWKDGQGAPVFCGDHVNDGSMKLFHGPGGLAISNVNPLPTQVAGNTWDGGPTPTGLVLPLYISDPYIKTTIPDYLQDICTLGRETDAKGGGSRMMQFGRLHFSDEGAVAVSHNYSRSFIPQVERVANCWNTFGPMCTATNSRPALNYTLTLREWYAASIGHPNVGWNAPAITDGMTAALFTQDVTFRSDANITVTELRVATGQLVSLYRNLKSLQLVYATSSTAAPQSVEVLGNESYKVLLEGCGAAELQAFGKCTVTLNTGGWFGAVSPQTSATQLYWNMGPGPINMTVTRANGSNQWLTLNDIGMVGQRITRATDRFSWSIASVSVDIKTNFKTVEELLQLRAYLAAPENLSIRRGTQVDHKHSLLELTPDAELVAELSIPMPSSPIVNPAAEALLLPLRVGPFKQSRWTVGLLQLSGYTVGYYGSGTNRYTSLGLDDDGFAYVPLYAGRAPLTHVAVGCPVIAEGPGAEDLFIQVTHVDEDPQVWHVEVNNPTDTAITVTFHSGMELPGFPAIVTTPVTIVAGEFVVL